MCADCKHEYPNSSFSSDREFKKRGISICKTCKLKRRYEFNLLRQEGKKIREENKEIEKREWQERDRRIGCKRCGVRGLKDEFFICQIDPTSHWGNRSYYCEKCCKEKKEEALEASRAKAALRRFNIKRGSFGNGKGRLYDELLESEMIRLKIKRILKQNYNI